MDACPLLITSIVAVKPEDQGTFFQDFLGLSGYLCSIGGFYSDTALLRTRNAQNHSEAQRLALAKQPVGMPLQGYWWAGVDSAWEQRKLEARKMPVNRADYLASSARGVRQLYIFFH